MDSNPQLAAAISASILVLACSAGCSTASVKSEEIQNTTRLAISPNGQRLVVVWGDGSNASFGKLLELQGSTVASGRSIVLPEKTKHIAFSSTNDQLIAVTFDQHSSELFKIDLHTNQRELIYKSQFQLGFPLEVSDGNHVFLESDGVSSSTWKRYRNGKKTQLSQETFRGASPLSVLGESLFLSVPTSPVSFLAIHGEVPEQAKAMLDKSTFFAMCADRNPLVCLRTNMHVVNDRHGYYALTMTIFNGQKRCRVNGNWIDPREVVISRDGSTIVFHDVVPDSNGQRAIYVIKNNTDCSVQKIETKGE